MEKIKKKHLLGLTYTLIITGLAYALAHLTGFLGSVVWGIFLGLIAGNIRKWPENISPGIKFSEKTVLSWAIITMGFATGRAFHQSIPWKAGGVVLAMVAVSILTGLILYKVFKLSKDDGILLGVGNAICGASAIAAVSGVINGNAKSTGTGIAVVNLLGILGMFGIPALLAAYPQDTLHSALYTGGTLQAVGQAVAAGNSISPEVGVWATTIKLFRVSLLLPVVLIFAYTSRSKTTTSLSPTKVLPLFLWLFLLTTSISYFVEIPGSIYEVIKTLGSILLTIAMVGIGWQINLKSLKTEGPKRLLLGSLIFIVQLITMMILIRTVEPSLI